MNSSPWKIQLTFQSVMWWVTVIKIVSWTIVLVWIGLTHVQWSIALVAVIIAAISLLLQFFQTWLQHRDTILSKREKDDASQAV